VRGVLNHHDTVRFREFAEQDLQGGASISKALEKHPKAFSPFVVNMVVSGEETGHLDEVFTYLAEYTDRSYATTSKARNAMIYPAFVVITFIAVMVLMLTMVIPKISDIILSSGQQIPLYTRIVLGFSTFFVDYGWFLLIAVVVGAFLLVYYLRTANGKANWDRFKISIPYVGDFYKKLYFIPFFSTRPRPRFFATRPVVFSTFHSQNRQQKCGRGGRGVSGGNSAPPSTCGLR